MKHLLEIAKAIAEGKGQDETKSAVQTQRAAITQEIAGLTNEDIRLLTKMLFGAEPKAGKSFYDALSNFQHHIGYGATQNSVVGRMWAEVFCRLSEDRGTRLLSALLNENTQGFWAAIRCLPTLCAIVELPPVFAAKWFHDLGIRVEGDLAGGDFYDAVGTYAEKFPASALAIFEQYIFQQLDPLMIHLAGLLLGSARAKSVLDKVNVSSVQSWDRKLQRSGIVQERLIYHKSLTATFNLGMLSISQLSRKLTKMLNGAPDEVSEAFDVVGRCLCKDRSDKKFIRFALEWFSRNSSSALPDLAKYHLVRSLWLLCSSNDVVDRASVISHANDLLVVIQPILTEHRGTWQDLENYLVSVLKFDHNRFEDVFIRLVKSNASGILEQIRNGDFLRSELTQANLEHLVTRLLLSTKSDEWEIGKSLFKDGATIGLSDSVLETTGETKLEIALLQSIRSPFLAEGTFKYLSQMEPYFRNASPGLQKAFKNELVVQAINYPGTCLKAWGTRTTELLLMAEAVKHAQKYFEDLSKLQNSSALSFSFPERIAGCQKADQVFRSKVMRHAKETSVFLKSIQELEIVYGNQWAIFVDGRLDGPFTFSEHSFSMESPRLEVIDPEGMVIRRLNASSRIEEIKGGDE